MHIRFDDEVDRLIRVSDRIRYLILFGFGKFHMVYNRIRYFISQESGVTYIIYHNFSCLEKRSYK